MIKEIIISQNDNTNKYYYAHIMFFKSYAEIAGIKIKMAPVGSDKRLFLSNPFSVLIDGKQALIDYADSDDICVREKYSASIPYFKYHFNNAKHGRFNNMYPLGPMMSYGRHKEKLEDLKRFVDYASNFKFNPTESGNIISAQIAYGNAKYRRREVQAALISRYGKKAITVVTNNRMEYLKKQADCLCSVCVPGQRIDILDRGQYESIAMGVCTISPPLTTVLPWGKEIKDMEHVIYCQQDFADLQDKIEWCKNNITEVKRIGDNAKRLFNDYCSPIKYFEWVEKCLYQTSIS